MRISGNNSTLHKGGHKAQSTGTDGGDNHLSSDDNSSLPLAVSPRDGLVKGAAVLGICGFIGKLLGAVYRIPLTNALGAEGMGLYQMVFPMYALLLTVSSSGLPSAISRLVAERAALNDREGGGRVLGAAAVTLAFFGALGAVCVYFFGGRIAGLQGNRAAAISYTAIAPAVFLVALISALRGYFQGRRHMFPSAFSQIVEQGVKMAAGLSLAYYALSRGRPVEEAVASAVWGISISEAAALAVLFIQYLRDKDRLRPLLRGGFFADTRKLYAISIPITLGGIVLPLTQLIDSVLIINLLAGTGESVRNATALYGLSTGPVGSLVNMPVVLSLAIGSALIPAISAARVTGNDGEIAQKATQSLKMTMLVALPSFAGLFVLARPIIELLYSGGLKTGEIDEPRVAAALLMLMSGSVLFVAFIQVSASILQALAKNYLPVAALAAGAGVKIALNLALIPRMGIYGSVAATLACYCTAFIINLFFLVKYCPLQIKLVPLLIKPLICTLLMSAAAYFTRPLFAAFLPGKLATLLAIAAAGAVYAAALLLTGVFEKNELERVKRVFKRRRV